MMLRLLPLLLSLLCLTGTGQSSNYRFRFADLPPNFRNQLIMQVEEDTAGMLWFTTNSGLHRFDGKQVLTFDMQSSPALPDINIRCLLADSHSNLWIATHKGLLRFDLKRWAVQLVNIWPGQATTTSDVNISSLTEEKNGVIYAGSITGKLFAYRNGRLQLVAHLRPPLWDSTGSLPSVSYISQVPQHTLWLTTNKGQIVQVNMDQPAAALRYYEPRQLAGKNIEFVATGKTAKVLLNTIEGKMYLLDTASATITQINRLPNLNTFGEALNHLIVSRGSKIAFFSWGTGSHTGYGEYNFSNYSFGSLNVPYTYSTDSCSFKKVLFKNGKVYAPTEKGIAIVSRVSSPFRTLQSNLENLNSIRTIFRQPGGTLLVASYKDKFVRVNETTDAVQPLYNQVVSCLIRWNGDTLLAGTELGLPHWYLPRLNKFVPIFLNNQPAASAKVNEHVLCLLRENDSLVWAGAYGGCYLFNPVKGTIVKTIYTGGDGSLQQQNVDDMLRVGNQRYFATTVGIFTYNTTTGQTRKLFTNRKDGYADAWYSCLQRVGNQLWAGTHGNGIVVFDTAGTIVKQITTRDGLAGNVVYSLPASGPFVMAGTVSGLSVINSSTGSIRNYSSSQHLPADEFNRGAWFVQGDTVYMGTVNGIVRFSLQQLHHSETQPPLPLRLISYSLNDGAQTRHNYSTAYTNLSALTIPAGTKSFSLSFGGLGESLAEMDLYYRFSTDSAWQLIGQQREITFVGLEPDRYQVQVAARLPDGQWTSNRLTIPVVVNPAFYQTIWFRLLLAALAVGLLWLGIRYREKTLLKEQQLRSRIAGDLHDEVGSALTRIYFQAGMLTANGANGSTPALHKIASSSQEALSSMSDMVWSIDAHYDNAPEMVSRMRDYIARLQDELDCRCTFEVSGHYEHLRLSQMVRQNLLLIFKEAMNNALKYGCQRRVAVELLLSHQLIHLQVKNALPEERAAAASTRQGGHGLESMKLRAGKIKATFSAKAAQGEFVVELKVKPF